MATTLASVKLYRLPKVISKKVGNALLGVAANRQVCPTFSEITFGNRSSVNRQTILNA
jgi:hypothetical protein